MTGEQPSAETLPARSAAESAGGEAESIHTSPTLAADADALELNRFGYRQELARCMRGFSNFAVSLSIICILAGGLTSFHLGFCAVGGAAIGIGWPLVSFVSLLVAASMAQIASAFPTAGGLYHWATILGGRGWGWATAWLNLAGLVTVLSAINVGAVQFAAGAFFPEGTLTLPMQTALVCAVTAAQAVLNHVGMRVTSRLIDLSGYLILVVSSALTLALLLSAESFHPERLWTFENYSGLPVEAPVWPQTESLVWLFLLGFLLPAYTITGFDASAHTSEETVNASRNAPRGIVRSVLVSGIFGWAMLMALVLAMPDMRRGAEQGAQVTIWTMNSVLSPPVRTMLYAGIVLAQFLCGLATVTSTSRMMFAFARDGGLPWSHRLRHVSEKFRTPTFAIWATAVLAALFTISTPIYSTITAVCTILLYLSYAVPIGLGFLAHGRRWNRFGPWTIGRWYRPAAIVSMAACLALIAVGMQPPNQKAVYVVGGIIVLLAVWWRLFARQTFPGPPRVQSLRQESAAATPP